MSLIFEVASAPVEPDRQRADVACFIGHVARRRGAALPASVRAQLRADGWIDGVWARSAAQIEALENLPVVIDNWALFDQLYAWERRPLNSTGSAVCATYLGAALRSFFARGGRRAIVIRVGDPWPFLEDDTDRSAQLRPRLRRLIPDFAQTVAPSRPFAPHDPSTWQGIEHLYGLRDNSFVLFPDLADACASQPVAPLATPAQTTPETFVECSVEAEPPPDTGLRRLPAPRLDSAGYAAWMLAVGAARGFLARRQREHLLLASLPLPWIDTRRTISGGAAVHAQADLRAYLERIGVLRPDGSRAPVVDGNGDTGSASASAFVQLAWPWLRSAAGTDLPEGLEPPEGVLAGLMASNATRRGCFRSVAGDFSLPYLRDLFDAEPLLSWGLGEGGAVQRLARQVCVFTPSPLGWMLQSDVTTSPQEAWRFGGASRLLASILHTARAQGDHLAFETNGTQTWARLRRSLEDLLLGYWNEGAFAGANAAQAFQVRCDRSTMTQADLDAGRLIAEISVRPAQAIEVITVRLQLGNAQGALGSTGLREAA